MVFNAKPGWERLGFFVWFGVLRLAFFFFKMQPEKGLVLRFDFQAALNSLNHLFRLPKREREIGSLRSEAELRS